MGDRDAFLSAVSDYLFLINRAYPEMPSVRLVGDRYRLSREERTMLYRGICTDEKLRERSGKLARKPCASELHVDGYNVFFTILNYRQGRPVFVSRDGFLRDAGGLHGRIGDEGLFREIVRDVLSFLGEWGVGSVSFYLDSPVSHSGDHAAMLRSMMAAAGLGGNCEICASADGRIKALGPQCAATSDTAIIDALPGRIYDLARHYLETRYGAVFFAFPADPRPRAD